MRISNLSNKSGNPTSNDYLVLDDGTTVTKIDYNKLAKAIIENYAASTLAGSAQSVKAALDSLNSNCLGIRGQIGSLPTSNIDSFAEAEIYGVFWLNVTDSTISGDKPPSSNSGVLFCLRQSIGVCRQLFLSNNGTVKGRYYLYSNQTWTSWT